MKIGIFGGTFNPPHLGHLAAAQAAAAALELDRLLIVPASIPPHKELPENTPSPEHRLAMAEIMADALLMPQVTEVSSLELDRAGKSYTADTLAALRGYLKGLFSDALVEELTRRGALDEGWAGQEQAP